MAKIKLLDERVYNQIAAGEVVERPACILRELLDNAIDSGADAISVEVSLDKSFSIEIIDNGCGMSGEDISLAFNKYATSKIKTFKDIYKTDSLGFRGEALAAISSVSLVECISSDNKKGMGNRIFLEGGEITEKKVIEADRGTIVRVKDIFYNTPVRKKFLKTASTEKSELKKEFIKHILSNNDIAFTFITTVKGKKKRELSIPKNFSLKDKITYLYGERITPFLVAVNSNKNDKIKVDGFITNPKFRNKSRRDQYFIVRNRVIQNSTLSSALIGAFSGMLPSGVFPACFLRVSISGDFIDINIHPAKKDVRFQESSDVYRAVYHSIRNKIYGSISSRSELSGGGSSISYQFSEKKERPMDRELSLFDKSVSDNRQRIYKSNESKIVSKRSTADSSLSSKEISIDNSDSINFFILGQIAQSYIVYSLGDDLFIVDQHALHERIRYDQIKKKIHDAKDYQYLLTPLLIKRGKSDINYLESMKEIFKKVGLEFELFGSDTLQIEKIPAYIPENRESEVINSMIDLLLTNKNLKKTSLLDKMISTVACRSSIMAGDRLSSGQMEEIISELYKGDYLQNCPHGRSFVKKISKSELDRFFDRI